ncbi:hypothetical protein D9M72_631440 [compost metagenome]
MGTTEVDLGGFFGQGQGRLLGGEPGAIQGAVVNLLGAAQQSAFVGVGSQEGECTGTGQGQDQQSFHGNVLGRVDCENAAAVQLQVRWTLV